MSDLQAGPWPRAPETAKAASGPANGAGAAAKPVEKPEAGRETQATILGQVVWLMMLSPLHRNVFLSELEWRILPAVTLGQCRMFRRKGQPFAFVTWAFVSDEIAGRLQAGPARLQPPEWRCGTRQVIVDVIAPFGGGDKCVAEITGAGQVSADTAKPAPAAN